MNILTNLQTFKPSNLQTFKPSNLQIQIQLVLSFVLLLTSFFSCRDTKIGDLPFDISESQVLVCPNFTANNNNNLYLSTCSGCDRIDLNPCDFIVMRHYANAVACELTKIINCPIPTRRFGKDCAILSNYYFCEQVETPPQLVANYGKVDIGHYCSVSSCDPYTCEVLGHTVKYHIPLSISDQDLIISHILTFVIPFLPPPPTCEFSDGNMQIHSIQFFTEKTGYPCDYIIPSCTDLSLKMRIHYVCYVPGGPCW
jgi:hypothetical protein